jgi:hypothetical protein
MKKWIRAYLPSIGRKIRNNNTTFKAAPEANYVRQLCWINQKSKEVWKKRWPAKSTIKPKKSNPKDIKDTKSSNILILINRIKVSSFPITLHCHLKWITPAE